ncbi:hypothetical protein C8A01DRAFT_50880 [Parachaetomium inaequale]|uniref:T6SS Phospholipase effector Tle1-like catalytic domain-containing protein n=1 Tax=Parachaetomium inaequale TaxID=2588326 RepID=A0AAN6P8I1_9PEZI|nr:hypothetical protein C8A01DRAFT_50880 [Parachaetomium inaequale]
MSAPPAKRRVIVLCDGTWCGRQTNTKSNVNFLARMIGVDLERGATEYHSEEHDIHAKYFDGVGLGGDLMKYLWDGALATHAKEECSIVYEFIVQYSLWDDQVSTEVWMFGISRGAYIVRSVAGMINNCGIIRNRANQDLIKQAFDVYQNPHPVHHPSSEEMRAFRANASYPVQSPVKFMGLFDTVGGRGVPRLNYNSGTGFEWPQLYDNCVSTVVDKVYHALSIHDRFWGFQPCLAFRAKRKPGDPPLPDLKIHQKWFPGCHYDLARQEFQFLREAGSWWEKLVFPILNLFSKTVSPNDKLADLVLIWILQGIEREGGGDIIHKDLDGADSDIGAVIAQTQRRLLRISGLGIGDMYDDILSYIPGGKVLSAPIRWFKNINKTAYAILFKGVERMIPDPGIDTEHAPVWNEVYDYTVPDASLGGAVVEAIAGMDAKRYPSRTFQNHLVYMQAVNRPS